MVDVPSQPKKRQRKYREGFKNGNGTQKGKMGRPPLLKADARTLTMLQGFGNYAATQKEMSGIFGVDRKTLAKFMLGSPEAQAAYDKGLAVGNIGLRRKQHTMASNGNVTLLIWLGKQRLGQADKVENTGADGAPLIPKRFALIPVPTGYHVPTPDDDDDKEDGSDQD